MDKKMIMSESIKEISKALTSAQSKMINPKKTKEAYGYKYAELSECLDIIRLPLAESELALVQLLSIDESGQNVLITMLTHSSGEWIKSVFPIKSQSSKQNNEMQALGSGITYLRRYALCSMLGIAQEDDDGFSSDTSKVDEFTAVLLKLCKDRGLDAKDFAKVNNIRSSEPASVKNAVKNFDKLVDYYATHSS